jgi:hypothetical protein
MFLPHAMMTASRLITKMHVEYFHLFLINVSRPQLRWPHVRQLLLSDAISLLEI